MGDTYTCLLTHTIFSTDGRQPWLSADIRPRIFAYIAGILKEIECPPILIGGVEDHVHALFYRHPAKAEAEIMRIVKANSSKWIHETFADLRGFAWQSGYAAFSVSKSNVDVVRAYIAGQEEHHKRMSWREETERFFRRHGLEFDPRSLE